MAGNVRAVEPVTNLQLVDPAVGVSAGSGQSFAVAEHDENAATTGNEAVPFDTSPSVQNVLVVNRGDDPAPFRRASGITLAGHHDADGCATTEAKTVNTGQVSTSRGSHDLGHR